MTHPGSPPRLVILASGNGSNAQVLLDATAAGDLHGEIVAVVSDHSDARVLERAASGGVAGIVLERFPGESRHRYDARLLPILQALRPELVILAGWMRILTDGLCRRFPIVNLHPALPGMFPGATAITDAFDAYGSGTVDHTGVMVHWVPDGGVDDGPVIVAAEVPIEPGDTLDTLTERVHAVEHRILPQAVAIALESGPPTNRKRPTPPHHPAEVRS